MANGNKLMITRVLISLMKKYEVALSLWFQYGQVACASLASSETQIHNYSLKAEIVVSKHPL